MKSSNVKYGYTTEVTHADGRVQLCGFQKQDKADENTKSLTKNWARSNNSALRPTSIRTRRVRFETWEAAQPGWTPHA